MIAEELVDEVALEYSIFEIHEIHRMDPIDMENDGGPIVVDEARILNDRVRFLIAEANDTEKCLKSSRDLVEPKEWVFPNSGELQRSYFPKLKHGEVFGGGRFRVNLEKSSDLNRKFENKVAMYPSSEETVAAYNDYSYYVNYRDVAQVNELSLKIQFNMMYLTKYDEIN